MSISTDSLASNARAGSGRLDRSLVGMLQADWRNMMYHEDSKDIKLIVGTEKETFLVHSLVLIARCNKLKDNHMPAMMQSPRTLTFQHLKPSAVRIIIHYLYSAELELTDVLDAISLQIVAFEFGLHNLRSYFIQCLEFLLTQNNVCKVLTIAYSHLTNQKYEDELHHDIWCYIDTCLQFITRNVKTIMASDYIMELDKDSLKLIVSSKLPLSNQEILKSLLRWGRLKAGTSKVRQSDWTEEERKIVRGHIDEIIPHVQTADGRPLSPDSITDGVYGILQRCSWAESYSLSSEERFPESLIFNERSDNSIASLSEWSGHRGRWVLLYRATLHGFTSKDFHSHCDNNGPTLILIKSTTGHIFGGFTDASWNSRSKRGKYTTSQFSFLFSLFNPTCALSTGPIKYPVRQPSYAINSHPHYGPIFGSGADLSVSNNCSTNDESYSRIPSSYGDDHTHQYSLTGSTYFRVEDYEVFGQQT